MNHITFQIPQYSARFKIKKPDESVIFETLSEYLSDSVTLQHIKRIHNTLLLKILPSKKQSILENQFEIIEKLKIYNIYIEKIV